MRKARKYTRVENYIASVLASNHDDGAKLLLIERYMSAFNRANTALSDMQEWEEARALVD